jgi:hypothetical protein
LPNHTDNVESYVGRISELLGKAKRARVHRDWYQREALGLRQRLQRYAASFDLRDVAVPESPDQDAYCRNTQRNQAMGPSAAANMAFSALCTGTDSLVDKPARKFDAWLLIFAQEAI